ncbi:MAG TPA: MFS transporter [Symbiobacteriaceae bacterium]|nr:MFS transporter [Symbiobacteriaceae bacterium]
MSKSYKRHFTVVALGTIATVGLLEGTRGVLLPRFLDDLALSKALGGAIFSATALGYLASSLSFGLLSQRFGLKRVLGFAALLLAVAMSAFVTLRTPVLLYATAIAVGAAISATELCTTLPISMFYQEKQSGILNLLHGFFGAGALSGTFWAALWLGWGAGWQVPYGLGGLGVLAWGGMFLLLPPLELPRPQAGQGGFGPLLKDPLVWAAALSLAVAVAGEVGTTLWLPTFLQKAKGLSERASSDYLMAFFAGFTATRLLGTWLVERAGPARSIVAMAAVGMVSLISLLVLPGAPIVLPVLAGAGVAIAFATCTALVATRHSDRVNQVYTIMYSAGGLAGLVTGPLMGWLGDRAGMTVSMLVPLVSYALLILLMSYYGRAARSAATRPAALSQG